MSTQNLIENNVWISVKELMRRYQASFIEGKVLSFWTFSATIEVWDEYFDYVKTFKNPCDFIFKCEEKCMYFDVRETPIAEVIPMFWRSDDDGVTPISDSSWRQCYWGRRQEYKQEFREWHRLHIKFFNFANYSATKQLVIEAIKEVEDSNEADDFSNLVIEYL